MLGTTRLDSENVAEDKGITLKEFLENQRKMELEAAAALPFRFDRCSAELGPLRQNLHICHNCPSLPNGKPAAFCYACAITCHNFEPSNSANEDEAGSSEDKKANDEGDVWDAYGDEANLHSIEEIWSRRNFLCDCPSTGHCKLFKENENTTTLTRTEAHQNSYHREHNFRGAYCTCQRMGWAAGDQTMYQCEVCEDWFHDSCVAKEHSEDTEIPDEDSFNDFICKTCVNKSFDSFFKRVQLNSFIFSFSSSSSLSRDSPLFLVSGWRESLREQFPTGQDVPCELGHLLLDQEPVYEPEIDTDAQESIYELGLKALEKSAPRDKAILGIKMIDNLKDRLKNHLESLVEMEPSHTITALDIRSFFKEQQEASSHGDMNRKRKYNY